MDELKTQVFIPPVPIALVFFIKPFLQNKFEYTHFNHTHDTLMSNLTESALVNLHKCKNQGVSQVNYCKSIAISKKSTVYLVLYTVRCRVQPPYATGL
ncbi:uncharacterized protein MELLADRAFT_87421 [Melampsora larici-populina 98AG31]|uniref:Uncharacterized protein n=1 Tax=Melampsora larici-populina (strain 98AG31 / pathotype 3-4-7) TaxID=747676 RepID=F4RN92_MELLP|nr:uncharacterized protein MELLADRAFT_87421 [Melampsora larici-populina 98AG31]EGG06259.1 hypothetical protein MELLADRAFT_87421 [Melampsora larici-populina 98AG31]